MEACCADGAPSRLQFARNAESDGAGWQFNTGTGLVRCSDDGLRLMNTMLEYRVTHAVSGSGAACVRVRVHECGHAHVACVELLAAAQRGNGVQPPSLVRQSH